MAAIGHRRRATVLWRLGEYFFILELGRQLSMAAQPFEEARVRAFAPEAVNKGVVVAGSGLIKMWGGGTL